MRYYLSAGISLNIQIKTNKRMKLKKLLVILIAISIVSNTLYAKNILLSEAIKTNLVSVKVKSADKKITNNISSYWGECIEISLSNNTSKPISIELEPGMYLSPSDSTIQKMMIIDNSIMMMAAKGTKTKTINAFCSQMLNSPPRQGIAFSPSGKADGDLLALANIIAKNRIFNYAAQNAVWVLTDNNSISSVHSDNKIETEILRNFLMKVKKVTINEIDPPTKIDRKNTNGNFILKINNKIGGKYTIVLFDSNGNQIQEFQKDKEYPLHDLITIKYRFQSDIPSGTYYVRMTRNNNELIHNKPVIVK